MFRLIAAAVLPITLFAAMSHFGWRGGYLLMAAPVLGVSLPMVLGWIRNDEGEPAARLPIRHVHR